MRIRQSTIMATVFVTALAVRLLYFAAFRGTPFAEVLLVDARWHHEWARDWAQGHWHLGESAFFRAPLYPYVLSLVYRIFGPDPDAARLMQVILGSSTAAAVAGTLTRVWGARAGWTAGLLVALNGSFLYFDHELLIPTLLLALLAWALFFTALSPGRGMWAGGLLLGLAVIARPNALVLVPLFAWLVWKQGVAQHRWRRVVAFVLLASAPAAGVTALNYRAEGDVVPVAAQGGINFYGGNNPVATGRSVDVPEFADMVDWREFTPRMQSLAEERLGRTLTSGEVSRYWFGRGWGWLTAHPGEAFSLYIKKVSYVVTGPVLANNRDPYFHRPWPLRLLLWDTPLFSFPGGLLLPLAAAGLVLLGVDPRTRLWAIVLGGAAVLYGLSLLPFFVCERFRLPVLLFLTGPAAWAMLHWRQWRRPAVAATLLLAVVVVNGGWFGARASRVSQNETQLGAALFEMGDVPGAEKALESAREADPEGLGAAFWLAHVYSRLGEQSKALPLYRELVAVRPGDPALWFQLGTSLLELGNTEEAVGPLQRAADLDPGDFRTWVNLGAAQEDTGMNAEAEASYRRAVALKPEHDLAYRRLADLLTRVDPDSPQAREARRLVETRAWTAP